MPFVISGRCRTDTSFRWPKRRCQVSKSTLVLCFEIQAQVYHLAVLEVAQGSVVVVFDSAALSVLHSCHINGTFILHFELTQKATPFVYLIFTIHQWGVLNWQVQPVVLGFEAAALDIAPSPPYLGAPLSVLCASSILHQWDLHLAFSKINPFSPQQVPHSSGLQS